jgi:aldose 1-epimerase
MKKIKSYSISVLTAVVVLTSCKNTTDGGKENIEIGQKEVAMEENLKESDFDTIIDGKQVSLFWIKNDSIKVAFTNYGGRIVGVWVPNDNGVMTDVVVGMGSTKAYVNSTEPYFGATIGRVGNRIAKGKFTLNGNDYTIPINNNGNTLHGGIKGYQAVVWDAQQPDEKTLVLKYHSPDMEEGFPGNLDVTVTYKVTEDRGINMEYEATTDKATPVNLTNHAFFNLNGEGNGSILNHTVQFNADKFTPVDEGLIPTGELKDVEGTPFDFREPHTIGERIETDNEQLKNGDGYDHNFVVNLTPANGMNKIATITGDKSGIKMDVFTEEPGFQFYSGNFMEGKNTFKSGIKDDYRTAFALETQHFPDAPNQANFPSIILEPGETYHTVSEYKFSTQRDNQ